MKPIFIIGSGRSGTSIFHQLLSNHPDLFWITKKAPLLPNKIGINKFIVKLTKLKFAKIIFKNYVKPSENYDLWESICTGFRRPYRDLLSDDLTNKKKVAIQSFLKKISSNGKYRPLIKITGWSRIGFLKEVFPDAKFIHIIRDGRGVTSSLLVQSWWMGWGGPSKWRWGNLSDKNQEIWRQSNYSFVALAGIQWNILIKAIEEAKQYTTEDDFLEIRYEDLCEDKINVLKNVTNYLEIEWSNKFEKSIEKIELKNANPKWKTDLTSKQQILLDNILKDNLKKYGYYIS